MFLRPQHFQQHDRFIEQLVEGRCSRLRPYPWGLFELQIDKELLTQGKLVVNLCRGVFPDGTPFNVPDDDDPPPPLDVPPGAKETKVYLALPVRQRSAEEVSSDDSDADSLARYLGNEIEVRDYNVDDDTEAQILTGKLRLKLLLENEERASHTTIPLTRIKEIRADKNLTLDERCLATCLDCRAVPRLHGFLKELQGLLHHRAEALAGRITQAGSGGASEVADFMILQAVNRMEPLFTHLCEMTGLHPEDFYRIGVQAAGELATFASKKRRPVSLPPYRHDDLEASFEPLMASLRASLSMVIEQNAIAIPLQEHKYGIRVAALADRTLLDTASFVLAANADMASDWLRRGFPTQVKIGPVEKIRQLVNLQLPGIVIRPLSVAPRQIPYHAGFTYFELDRTGELWKELKTSGGFAFFVGAEFPGLKLEFWAIKG
jgi:type VI secretion system protein ImpJ